jgi:hypothetical protein
VVEKLMESKKLYLHMFIEIHTVQLQVENQRAQNNLKLKDKYTLQDPNMGGGSSNSICGCGGGSA